MALAATEALVVLARVRAGEDDAARQSIRTWWSSGPSPFATVPGTHLGRLQVLRPPRRRWRPRPAGFLLLAADVDAPVEAWLVELCSRAAPAVDAVLSHCASYPGARDPAAFARWIEANRLPVGFSMIAAPDSRTAQVREALRLREELGALAVRMQDRGAETPVAEWRERLRA